jgi:tRNA1Val (adenine37-N6)-methyltransferase
MNNIFQFKKFKIDQSDCAMKVNTDGVLLAALVQSEAPQKILDIGTGTGLIALMLAQRFTNADIDAVEIDQNAAKRAEINFIESPFAKRLNSHHLSIEEFFLTTSNEYDLMISNPPYFLNSLKSKDEIKEKARHTTQSFFENLLDQSSKKLSPNGYIALILPIETSTFVENRIKQIPNLHINEIIFIHSFEHSVAHRKILKMSLNSTELTVKNFVIYEAQGIYSFEYQSLLKDFLTIF